VTGREGKNMSGIDVMKETDSPITAQLGAAPGDLIHIGQAPDSAPRVSIIKFTRQEYREEQCPLHDVASCCASALQSEAVSWINVEGIHDASVIGTIGDAMGLHPLTCEDIMNAS
jgi:magnesium transporter